MGDEGATGTTTTTTASNLGGRLRQARELKQMSISAVANKADISTAYLQKLEVGDVKSPSPKSAQSVDGSRDRLRRADAPSWIHHSERHCEEHSPTQRAHRMRSQKKS